MTAKSIAKKRLIFLSALYEDKKNFLMKNAKQNHFMPQKIRKIIVMYK